MPTTDKLFAKQIGEPEFPPSASKECSNSTFSVHILVIFPEELFKLKHLSTLDLRNNQFSNFELLVQKLITLNNLKDLKIDLIDQNQVLMILSQIPKIMFFNE